MTADRPSADALQTAEQIVAVLRQLGLEDSDICAAAIEALDSVTEPIDAVAIHGTRLYDLGTERQRENAPTGTLQTVLSESPLGLTLDHTYHHKRNLEHNIDSIVEPFGYRFEFEPIGCDQWIEPTSEAHPRAFRLTARDETGEIVATAPFRYPPVDSDWYKTNNLPALALALNRTVFAEIDIQLRCLAHGDDAHRWIAIDRQTLETLETEYGPRLEMFAAALVECEPHSGWYQWYDPSIATDHEAQFGVSEPAETFRPERELDSTSSASGGDRGPIEIVSALIRRLGGR